MFLVSNIPPRLLILADMLDVHALLGKLHRVEDDLAFLRSHKSKEP